MAQPWDYLIDSGLLENRNSNIIPAIHTLTLTQLVTSQIDG